MRGTHTALEESQLINGIDHAKLVEIPQEHQTPHYIIFTEVLAMPRKSLNAHLEYDFLFQDYFPKQDLWDVFWLAFRFGLVCRESAQL